MYLIARAPPAPAPPCHPAPLLVAHSVIPVVAAACEARLDHGEDRQLAFSGVCGVPCRGFGGFGLRVRHRGGFGKRRKTGVNTRGGRGRQ